MLDFLFLLLLFIPLVHQEINDECNDNIHSQYHSKKIPNNEENPIEMVVVHHCYVHGSLFEPEGGIRICGTCD